jgi:hypothetical protein
MCEIPLEQIYLMATPLHSQNFVDVKDGILTNNRRIVTRNMWFNGTELTARAQRALRNEQVTIVANNTGYIHAVYPEATMDQASYEHFAGKLASYLSTKLDMEILANFLRDHSKLQTCFQFKHIHHGKPRYIPAEKVYSYEHGSSFKASDKTRDKLLDEIDEYEFYTDAMEDRIPLNKFEDFFRDNNIDLDKERDQEKLMEEFNCYNARARDILQELKEFIHIEPRLPVTEKTHFVKSSPIAFSPGTPREEIIQYLESIRADHPIADLAFYAYRDLSRTEWGPFLKAALERNPVAADKTGEMSDEEVIGHLANLPNESIYDGSRLAQPDEVWNFRRGDGLERAITLAAIWKSRHPDQPIELVANNGTVSLQLGKASVQWPTAKELSCTLNL